MLIITTDVELFALPKRSLTHAWIVTSTSTRFSYTSEPRRIVSVPAMAANSGWRKVASGWWNSRKTAPATVERQLGLDDGLATGAPNCG